MAKKNKKNQQTEENLVAVEEALSKTEQFIEDYKHTILYVIVGIAVIILGIMGYQRYIMLPRERDAQADMYMAERYFEKDSLNLALQGDGSHLGFLNIIDEYGNTQSGNLAQYYAGVSYLKLGNYDKAIEHLKDFKAKDLMVKPMALGNIGNAYMEKGNMEEAAEYYEKAVEASDENKFTTPEFLFRLGMTYELMDQYDKALEAYKQIDKEYPDSFIKQNIDKYIARAESKKS